MKIKIISVIIGIRGIISCLYGDSWIFATKEEVEAAFPEKNIICSTIVDPSYDQTFKYIMSTDTNKVKYLMNFLNSIYFPGAKGDDVMIRSIEPLDKEKTELGKTDHNGITMCDVACKCVCYGFKDKSSQKRTLSESFDIEMQRSAQEYFTMRLIDYGQTLYSRHKNPVKALGLLNYPFKRSFEDESKCYAWCEIDPETNKPTRLIGYKNILETNTIDLRKLATTEKISINGEKLRMKGITWLKLFGVKQWCKPTTLGGIQYEIYYPESIDPEIKEVIDMLSKIDSISVERMTREKENEEDVLNTAKKQGARTKAIETARNFLGMGLSIEQVAAGTGLTEEDVKALVENVK